MLQILSSNEREAIAALLNRRSLRLAGVADKVAPILDAVQKQGDKALLEYAHKLDHLEGNEVRLSASRLQQAQHSLSGEFLSAISLSASRIRQYAQRQMPHEWMERSENGIELGQLVRPLDSVGAYIPGGRYPLPSTLLMTTVPAQVAGVRQIAIATPGPVIETLGTAAYLGIENVFAMGGAQAIAAFAFGTETVPKVDRIVGPGNIYVAAAKKLLAGEVGIDFIAGPTEIMLIFEDGDPHILASDMLAQAEHDVDSCAVLLTPSQKLAEAVCREVDWQLSILPTSQVASESIRLNSAVVVTDNLQEACAIANDFAPEHLVVSEAVPLHEIRHAGSIFVGAWSPEAAGDYTAGPNHVLPTSGVSRLRGGLSVLDYIKIISVQKLSEQGLRELAPAITTLARSEGLEAHARSIEARTMKVSTSLG